MKSVAAATKSQETGGWDNAGTLFGSATAGAEKTNKQKVSEIVLCGTFISLVLYREANKMEVP